MATVAENQAVWDNEYNWPEDGDEWSEAWGGAAMQWYGSIYPRLRCFLPASRIVEIAPGHGRWTEFLLTHCDELIGVDLAQRCIDKCTARFEGRPGVDFYVNDGRSLPMVADAWADFVFSYDSLVHVDADVLSDYLKDLSRVLSPDGVAFLHHSNSGGNPYVRRVHRYGRLVDERVPRLHGTLLRAGLIDDYHWRSRTVTAQTMAHLAEASGLRCVGQELVNWGTQGLADCMSLIARPGSKWDRPNTVVSNRNFMAEAKSLLAGARAFRY